MARIVTRLRYDWKFTRDVVPDAEQRDVDDAQWETVSVPHDWAIAGPFDREHDIDRKVAEGQADVEADVTGITGRTGGLPHIGEAWYRKWVDVPEPDGIRRYRLECDGIMSRSTVFCNGQRIGSWPYGYSSFAFDITDAVEPGGPNLIAVHVDNPGRSSRWYPGAGIYRNVRLVELPLTHVDHWGVCITTPTITNGEGTVCVRTTVRNTRNEDTVLVRTVIRDRDGDHMAQLESSVSVADSTTVEQTLVVDSPQLWSPDSPVQYVAVSEIVLDGTAVDYLETKFGFRTLRFDPNLGMFLNGQPIKMKGVCMHHDLGPLGAAVNGAALHRQLTLLKEMGCNAIRTSHNPPDPALPAIASDIGLLIIDEAFDQWKHAKMPNGYNALWADWAEKDMRALVRRDRNHPSVIMWSVGNEVQDQWHEEGGKLCQFLVDICKDEDPTRPTTAGFNKPDLAIKHGLADAVDIPGWNYRPGLYVHFHTIMPGKPMYGSETQSTFSSRGEFYFPAEDEWCPKRDTLQVNSYALSTPSFGCPPDVEFRAQDECDFIMGEFVWTGFDYLGEPGPYMEEWPCRSSYFGIFDLGGLPKDRYYLFKSKWTDEDVMHLIPHWTWPGHEGKPVPVHCYSNAMVVELFVNGVSMGRVSQRKAYRLLASPYRFIWNDVPYEPGEIKAVGYDAKGTLIGECVVRTAGEPAAVQLIGDRTEMQADGEDMAFITAQIVDAEGIPCPRADNSISFSIDGPAELTGLCNGDATSLESFKGMTMKAFNGKCVAYIASQEGRAGEIMVTATAEGLSAGVARLSAV